LGRVTHNGKFLKATDRGNGYLTVHIEDKNRYLHRIVAQAFIPNPENKPQVNHIDGNRSNDCVENLEWVSRLENVKHAKEILKRDWCMVRYKVQMITKDKNILFNSIADAERYLFGKRTKTVEAQIRRKGYYSKNNILIY
jgi:Mg2+/Co2+ transporter CorC